MQEIKKLYRSGKNRVIAGVCGGLGEYFEIDPVLIRAIFVFLGLASGVGILLYIVLVIVLPQNPTDMLSVSETTHQPSQTNESVAQGESRRSNNSLGIIILCIGIFFLLQQIFPFFFRHMNWGFIWPLGLVILGAYMITHRDKK